MRLASLVVCSCAVVAAACSTGKKTASDTNGAAQAGTPAASPAGTQSLAQLAGNWSGRTLARDRDSTVGTWTFAVSGDNGTVTFANGTKVPVHEIRVAGDSILSKMGPWTSPTAESKGRLVAADVVSRVRGDSLLGTVVSYLVSKPDSITGRVRIEGTRAKP